MSHTHIGKERGMRICDARVKKAQKTPLQKKKKKKKTTEVTAGAILTVA